MVVAAVPIDFVSTHPPTVRALAEAFSSGGHNDVLTFTVGDVRDLPIAPGTMFMSPANSIGFMDGGIDAAYMAMFPGVQTAVQSQIRSLGKTTALGRHYLPVGSAVVVPVGFGCTLVSAPTMFLPHDVSGTRNAYHAMMAALMAFAKQGGERLVATGLCCGYGKMDPVVSAGQIREAYDDFLRGYTPPELERMDDPSFVVTQDRDDEQPANYDNREIHEIIIRRPEEHQPSDNTHRGL